MPRDVLLEALWPGEDPVRVGRRLSVALSILRSVLDPGKQFEPDRFVVSERSALSLRRHSLVVDVDDFLDEARAGLAGDPDRLLAAEEAYTGDLLEGPRHLSRPPIRLATSATPSTRPSSPR